MYITIKVLYLGILATSFALSINVEAKSLDVNNLNTKNFSDVSRTNLDDKLASARTFVSPMKLVLSNAFGNLFSKDLANRFNTVRAQLTAMQLENAKLTARTATNVASRDFCVNQVAGLTMTPLATGVYYFYTDVNNPKDWFEANSFCRSRGMQLVSIESAAENNLLKSQAQNLFSAAGGTPNLNTFFWTSLNKNSGSFVWQGTGEAPVFTDWLADNNSPDGDGNCVEMFQFQTVSNIHWNDRPCTWKGRFICEMSKTCASYWTNM